MAKIPLVPENCTLPEPSSYQFDNVYVVLAVATATLSFYLNLSQFIVIIHQKLLKNNKNIIIINLCVSGQLSSFTVFWYIYRVMSSWRAQDDSGYLLCFLVPSGLHLLTLFTFTPLITLLVLQHHLVTSPRGCSHVQNSQLVVALLVILAWCEAIIISIIPLTGWNNWDQTCSVPQVWSPSFSVLICVIYFLHYPMVLILVMDLCLWSSKRNRTICPEAVPTDECDEKVGAVLQKSPPDLSLRGIVILFIVYIMGTLPFICYTARVAMYQEADVCQSLVANERAAMWTSWVTVVFAAVRPLYHALVDDDLGESTAQVLVSLCKKQEKNVS